MKLQRGIWIHLGEVGSRNGLLFGRHTHFVLHRNFLTFTLNVGGGRDCFFVQGFVKTVKQLSRQFTDYSRGVEGNIQDGCVAEGGEGDGVFGGGNGEYAIKRG